MVCQKCLAEIPDTAKFCNICGNPTDKNDFSARYEPEWPTSYPNQQQAVDAPMSTKQFVCAQLLSMIPIVNIVLLVVWGFTAGTNTNRRNWARSMLIIMGIGVAISMVLMIVLIPIIILFVPEIRYFIEQFINSIVLSMAY